MPDKQHSPSAVAMAHAVKAWWDEQPRDSTPPRFVDMAKAVIGDWDKGFFTARAYRTREEYRAGKSDDSLSEAATFQDALRWANDSRFASFYDVVVTAHDHPDFEHVAGEMVFRRFSPEPSAPGAKADDAGWFDVKAYRTKEYYDEGVLDADSLDGFTTLEFATEYAVSAAFNDFYQVDVVAYGEHDRYEPCETAFSRFQRPD